MASPLIVLTFFTTTIVTFDCKCVVIFFYSVRVKGILENNLQINFQNCILQSQNKEYILNFKYLILYSKRAIHFPPRIDSKRGLRMTNF